MVRDVVQIALKAQPGGLSDVKGEAATEADVQIVVARTIDVVGSGTGRVAEDEVSVVYECIEIDEAIGRCMAALKLLARDAVTPFAIDARRAREGRIIGRHAGALRGIGSAG